MNASRADRPQAPPLRAAAEAQLAKNAPSDNASTPDDHLLHELQVHQIELVMQNEALRHAQIELEESRDRYVDLYEFAPVGYLTLTEEGLIAEINLTGSTLLGRSRELLLRRRFTSCVLAENRDQWVMHFMSLKKQGGQGNLELTLVRGDGSGFQALLDCVCTDDPVRGAGIRITLSDITQRKLAEEELRIAAIAFECQEGIVIMDADRKILRVNRAFAQITGYSQEEAQGKTTRILRTDRHTADFYDSVWRDVKFAGAWQGEMWHRRKSGEIYPDRVTITAVYDASGTVTHYVASFTDATNSQLQEQKRLRDETAHRVVLVREVHHRIKNNLQGITGLLRQYSQRHPVMTDTINQAIGQVQGISVVHGLQGRAVTSSVRLCELTVAIAQEIQSLWQTSVVVDIPPVWIPCVIVEPEAVPVALILNELILNAVKHGGKAHGRVDITIKKGAQPNVVQISIANQVHLSASGHQPGTSGSGLQLVASLMPRTGCSLHRSQLGDLVVARLSLEPPVIYLDQKGPA